MVDRKVGRKSAASSALPASLCKLKKQNSENSTLFLKTLLLLLVLLQSCSCDEKLPLALAISDDLDNSILAQQAADVSNNMQVGASGQVNSGALSQSEPKLETANNANAQDAAQQQIERRLDRLEFELRKSVHLMRANLAAGVPSESSAQQAEAKWTSLAARLEVMEKFVAVAATKLYETEQRVRQLEKCDCKLRCKWAPQSPRLNNDNHTKTFSKLDGELWRDKCDVCSCHRGSVRCKHVSCPQAQCSDPRHVAGKCCPVCFKPCVYKSQTVRHGNKLVINSNKDSCKECMCFDGRFRCQRVEIDGGGGQRSTFAAQRRQQRSTIIDLAAEAPDYDSYESTKLLQKRHTTQSQLLDSASDSQQNLPLVCPQIDCKHEDQMQLKNDCCTYCRGFDFCAHRAHLHCHPSAFCINTQAIAAEGNQNVSSNEGASNVSVGSMFSCHCKPGYKGDGQFCQDIDECADKKLNNCDPKTTQCFNLPGSFECRCRQGFKAKQYPESSVSNGGEEQDNVTSVLIRTATPMSEFNGRAKQSCVDINECSDGKLNRCHPQARCINKRGSYKCDCKHGFLGDGFECHKWFSTDSDVAAYLYRHLPADESKSVAASEETTKRINLPLDSLADPDEDRSDRTRSDNEVDSSRGEDEDDLDNEDDDLRDEEQLDDGLVPKLSESKWEPLQFDWSLSRSTSQQLDQLPNNQATVSTETPTTQTIDNNNPPYLQSLSLNTRTMFFQPPPSRFWNVTQKPIASDTSNNINLNAQTMLPDGEKLRTTNDNINYSTSDINDSTYIQRTSETVYNHDPRQVTSVEGSTSLTNSAINEGTQAKRIGSLNSSSLPSNTNGSGHRRGAIIASATTTPTKGYRQAYTSSKHRFNTLGPNSAAVSVYSFRDIFPKNIFTKSIYIQQLLYLLSIVLLSIINHVVTFYFI